MHLCQGALLSVLLQQNMQSHARRPPALQNFILGMSGVGQWYPAKAQQLRPSPLKLSTASDFLQRSEMT